MTIRLHFIVEGQSEETFINRSLIPHLANYGVVGDVRCVMTSKKRGIKYRGGLSSYSKAKRDITLWMREDQKPDSFFTTMFDLYRLPADFPGIESSNLISDPYDKVQVIENELASDIGPHHFIPHIQLHEFETLLFVEPSKLLDHFPSRDAAVESLKTVASQFDSPELIDGGEDSSPSKRIIREIPEYEKRKVSAGVIVACAIGLADIRTSCPHFDCWISRLESISR